MAAEIKRDFCYILSLGGVCFLVSLANVGGEKCSRRAGFIDERGRPGLGRFESDLDQDTNMTRSVGRWVLLRARVGVGFEPPRTYVDRPRFCWPLDRACKTYSRFFPFLFQ